MGERLQIWRGNKWEYAELKDVKSGDRFRVTDSAYVKEMVADCDAFQESGGDWIIKVRK